MKPPPSALISSTMVDAIHQQTINKPAQNHVSKTSQEATSSHCVAFSNLGSLHSHRTLEKNTMMSYKTLNTSPKFPKYIHIHI